ncbi:MAG: hypothetical protein AB1487_00160 [Thermodesulfobacteriota bacterium]
MNVIDKKKELVNKVISAAVRKQEEKTEEDQIADFSQRLRAKEEQYYKHIINRIQKEHRAILEIIERKVQEAGQLHLGLVLKARYLEMEETNLEMEICYRWKSLLPDMLKPNTGGKMDE